jgi:hypothetical protein
MTKYTAEVGGHSIGSSPARPVGTITEGREYAESYGTTADWCNIYRGLRIVASHRRDASGARAKARREAFEEMATLLRSVSRFTPGGRDPDDDAATINSLRRRSAELVAQAEACK